MRPRRRLGSTTGRGYGYRHQVERSRWEPQVRAGLVDCARCGIRIQPGEPWDLGHDDHDRHRWTGPEHRACNRATAGRNGSIRTGSVSGSFSALEEKVPFGIVRCGLCGWRIQKGVAWTVGEFGPEHEVCENEPYRDYDPFGVRLWSVDW